MTDSSEALRDVIYVSYMAFRVTLCLENPIDTQDKTVRECLRINQLTHSLII